MGYSSWKHEILHHLMCYCLFTLTYKTAVIAHSLNKPPSPKWQIKLKSRTVFPPPFDNINLSNICQFVWSFIAYSILFVSFIYLNVFYQQIYSKYSWTQVNMLNENKYWIFSIFTCKLPLTSSTDIEWCTIMSKMIMNIFLIMWKETIWTERKTVIQEIFTHWHER